MDTAVQNTILALHGLSNATESSLFEVESLPKVSTDQNTWRLKDSAEKLINQLFEPNYTGNSANELEQVYVKHSEQLKRWLQFEQLTPIELQSFDLQITNTFLNTLNSRMTRVLSDIREFESSSDQESLRNITSSSRDLLELCAGRRFFLKALPETCTCFIKIGQNLDHDLSSILGNFRDSIESLSLRKAQVGLTKIKELALCVQQIVLGTTQIVRGEYQLERLGFTDLVRPLLQQLANRYEYELSFSNTTNRDLSVYNISVDIDDTVKVPISASALALVLYNIIKNPIKSSFEGLSNVTKGVGVHLSVEYNSDKSCCFVYVRDNGIGFSYDTLSKIFTERAEQRLHRGDLLSEVDRLLLSEAWAPHFPLIALTTLIMDRGASATGGTGIGLSIAREIVVTGHDGEIAAYNHPHHGAGVLIIIPDIDPALPSEQRRAVTKIALEQRLREGLVLPTLPIL